MSDKTMSITKQDAYILFAVLRREKADLVRTLRTMNPDSPEGTLVARQIERYADLKIRLQHFMTYGKEQGEQ